MYIQKIYTNTNTNTKSSKTRDKQPKKANTKILVKKTNSSGTMTTLSRPGKRQVHYEGITLTY